MCMGFLGFLLLSRGCMRGQSVKSNLGLGVSVAEGGEGVD